MFWASVWKFCDVKSSQSYDEVPLLDICDSRANILPTTFWRFCWIKKTNFEAIIIWNLKWKYLLQLQLKQNSVNNIITIKQYIIITRDREFYSNNHPKSPLALGCEWTCENFIIYVCWMIVCPPMSGSAIFYLYFYAGTCCSILVPYISVVKWLSYLHTSACTLLIMIYHFDIIYKTILS